MLSGLNTAAAGMAAQQQRMDAVANDLANANTTGYKHQRVGFRDLVYEQTGRSSAQGVRTGSGAAAVDAGRAFAQGVLQRTDRPLDVAIQGEGYFAVNTPNGVRYTRAGDFRLDAQGRLVTSTGLVARGARGTEIRIPPDAGEVSIEGDGRVMAGADQVGQLELARFAPASLRREGDNLYAASAAPLAGGPPVELLSGALEGANVNVVRGMVDLVKVSRTYDSLMKMIQGYRDIDAAAARGLGKAK